MISLKAFGSLELVQGAIVFVLLAVAHRFGKGDGREELRAEMAERRSWHRAEQRAIAAGRGHQLAPFPDEQEFEKLATTGELRAYAETGDLGSLHRETAAFFRILSLREWTRKRENAT